ncbi:hypothetical protein V6259_18860 [Marinomonas sp. TI.3.20]|uniref:secretion/conjugation apparatus DotM-related subunit n=1 Tax=Marinomonas sp. TI.3.20 TaxID=3121296 RepID=UPI00311D4C2D
MSANTNQNGESDGFALFLLGAVILVILCYFLNNILRIPAHYMSIGTFKLVNQFPMIDLIVPDSFISELNYIYEKSKYGISGDSAIHKISVCLMFYYPIPLFLFWRRMRYYFIKTKPYSFRYKINKINEIIKIKSQDYPAIIAGYKYGALMAKNPKEQAFGSMSMEHGPIRFCILNKILSYNGKILTFDKTEDSKYVTVEDDIQELGGFSGKLDININKLTEIFQKQLGQPIVQLSDLTDVQVALCNLFLNYAKGHENKSKAQAYSRFLARSCVIENLGTKKEVKKFNFNRKKEENDLKQHLLKANKKLINYCKFDKIFVLTCYYMAKANGADLSPPEFLWSKVFERDLYLLLNTYTGSPDVYKNNAYIECISPLSLWLDLFIINKLDTRLNLSNEDGTFDYNEKWKTLLLQKVSSDKNPWHKKTNQILQNLANEDNPLESFKKNRRFKKLKSEFKLDRADSSLISDYTIQSSDDLILSLSIQRFIKSEKNVEDWLSENVSWVIIFDRLLFSRIATAVYVMDKFKDKCDSLVDVLLTKQLSKIERNKVTSKLKNVYINIFDDFTVEVIESEEFIENSTRLSDGWVEILIYLKRQIENEFTSIELNDFSKSTFYSVNQSVKSVLYYMTTFEKWLKPQYKVDENTLIGGE